MKLYRCQHCGLVSVEESGNCPACGHTELQRHVSAFDRTSDLSTIEQQDVTETYVNGYPVRTE